MNYPLDKLQIDVYLSLLYG